MRAKALVLGPKSVAEMIAGDLEAEGFEACLQADVGVRLPSYGDPQAAQMIQDQLKRFIESQPTESGDYCLHPGVSSWGERPELVLIGQALGFNVIAPPPKVLSLYGDKLSLLAEADRLGIPNLVLSFDPIHSVREVESLIGGLSRRYPFVLKSVRGGGGFGLSVMHEAADVERKLPLWLEQLRMNFGEAILFIEKYVESARRISLPFARFGDGHFKLFPIVDSSLQSRSRKVLEFCPATELDDGVRKKISEWAHQLAAATHYIGVGSFEFLVDGPQAYLLEGVPRLNIGYRLWERVAGTSAVSWQLATLGSGSHSTVPAQNRDRAFAAGLAMRFYAEDSVLQLPQPGQVYEVSPRRKWELPGARAELNLSIVAGDVIAANHSGLLGMAFVGGSTRKDIINVARGMLEEIWIAGSVQTNSRFLLEVLGHPWVREGMFHAAFIDEEFIPELRPSVDESQIFAALGALVSPRDPDQARWCVGSAWMKTPTGSLEWVDGPYFSEVAEGKVVSGTVALKDGRHLRACLYPLAENRWQGRVGMWELAVRQAWVAAGKKAPGTRRLMALVSGRVHSMLYREGAMVPSRSPIVVVESLRALVPHAVPTDMKLVRWSIGPEDWVKVGQELAELEPVDSAPADVS